MSEAQSDFGTNPLAETALGWVVRRDRGLTQAELRELTAWLAKDPVHREQFSQALECWSRLDRLPRVPSLAEDAEAIVVRAKARARLRKRLYISVAGLAAALVIGLSLINARHALAEKAAPVAVATQKIYQVLESTARHTTLSDGSTVELNGDSRITIDFTPEERRVNLIAGEAQFFVTKDTQRPFVVAAQGVSVRAVGTAFNVRLASSSVEVLVTEGKILLHRPLLDDENASSIESAPSVVAGELAIVSTGASQAPISIGKAGSAEINQLLAWQTTRLVFDRTPLIEVIGAFNRYNPHQLVLGSAELHQRTLSGVFRADNLEGFLRLLEVSVDVRAEKQSELETVLFPVR